MEAGSEPAQVEMGLEPLSWPDLQPSPLALLSCLSPPSFSSLMPLFLFPLCLCSSPARHGGSATPRMMFPPEVGGSQIRTKMGTPKATGHLCVLAGVKQAGPPLAISCLNPTHPLIQLKWHLHQEALPDHSIVIALPSHPHPCHLRILLLAFPLTFIVNSCAY